MIYVNQLIKNEKISWYNKYYKKINEEFCENNKTFISINKKNRLKMNSNKTIVLRNLKNQIFYKNKNV